MHLAHDYQYDYHKLKGDILMALLALGPCTMGFMRIGFFQHLSEVGGGEKENT